MIKVVSFDVWLTLIKSNPAFKPKRTEIIDNILMDMFGTFASLEKITTTIKKVDVFHTQLCERTGRHTMLPMDLWMLVFSELGVRPHSITEEMRVDIERKLEAHFFDHPPELISPRTEIIMREILSMGIKGIYLISNTGFISGSIIRSYLEDRGMMLIFENAVFSDEESIAKPNPAIFERIVHDPLRDRNEYLHVGDSVVADFRGAKEAGMNALIINGPTEITLEDVPPFIKQLNSRL